MKWQALHISYFQDIVANNQKPRSPEELERLQWQPLAGDKSKSQPKFEAYMMTGEHILNISRVPQTSAIVPKQQKKVSLSLNNLLNSFYRFLSVIKFNSKPPLKGIVLT